MGASATIKKGKDNGQDIRRGTEATTADVNEFVLILDENDPLFCNGVTDKPSEWLVNGIEENGWKKGETIACVNRGKPGGALVLVVADGRSRVKATRLANERRANNGLEPVRPEFVLVSEDEGYVLMHISANKQERKPLFEARCWAHHKRMYAKKIGSASLSDSEVRDARKEYAGLRKCTPGQIKGWELMLSAHPDVLRMFDDGAFKKATLLFLVENAAYADQPQAARDITIELANKPKAEEKVVESPRDSSQDVTNDAVALVVPDHDTVAVSEPVRPARSERSARNKALGIDAGPKVLSVKKLSWLAAQLSTIEDPELVDPRVMLAYVLGQSEFDGIPIEDHPSMVQVMRMVKRGSK